MNKKVIIIAEVSNGRKCKKLIDIAFTGAGYVNFVLGEWVGE